MKLAKITIQVPEMSPSEYEDMPQEQQDRVQELKRKLEQYDGMLKTFVQKYSGQTMKHRTFEEVINSKK